MHTPVASGSSDDRTLQIHGGPGHATASPRAAPRPGPAARPPQTGPGFPQVRGYEIHGVVGAGGMGIVYEARHRELNRRVAIKTLRGEALADPECRERFRAEAEAIARLQHPNIIQVFEVGVVEAQPFESHPSPFIALEYVDGGSLARQARSPQPPRDAARTVEALARAAHAAHALGVIHRDLKPANVLLTPGGEPKIADFGIAKQLGGEAPTTADRAVTRAGLVLGTPEYMAPEQFSGGTPTPAIDVYSLGVILYELLTGRVPFQGATFADTVRLALSAEPVSPRRLQPAVPRDLETICLKCLEKTPGKRYASAQALADDLARWQQGRSIRARAIGPAGHLLRLARRNPTAAALSVAVCLVGLLGLTGVLSGWSEARQIAAIADANALAARDAENNARQAERSERWERYRVSVMAASSALRLHDINAARSALDGAPESHRDWVWRLLSAQLDRSRAVLRGQGAAIRNARFTPDARWAVVHGFDDAYRVWDVARRREYAPLDLGPDPRCPVLSEDGTLLAYGTGDHTVRLQELATGVVRTVLRGHGDAIDRIIFSKDGRRVTTTSCDRTVRTWDAATGRQLSTFQAPPDAGLSFALSPDTRLVAMRGDSGSASARVWDLQSGRLLRTLGGHRGDVRLIEFSPTGDRAVTAERFPYTNLYLWDLSSGQRLAVLSGHENQITRAAFSPDGTRLVTTSMDRTVRVWDVSPGTVARPSAALLVLAGHAGAVDHAAFSPDGRHIASSSQDRTIRYWDAQTGEPLAVLCGHTDEVIVSAFRAGGTELVSASADGTLRVWDMVGAASEYAVSGHRGFVYSVAYFPDGRRFVSAAWDGTARVWDPSGREQLRLDHGDDRYVVSAAVHQAGRFIATLSRREGRHEMSVRLWDAATGAPLCRWVMPAAWQDGRVAFAPRGDCLAAGAQDGRVRIWNAATRAEVAVLECGTQPIRDVAFSPDGRLLAVGCDDGDCTVRIWDVAERRQLQVLHGHTQGVYALAWNRSGSVLASASLDQTVRLWDRRTWAGVAELRHPCRVYGVAFAADGRLLACACADNLIRLWDVDFRREFAALSGHKSYVHQLAFSPDGTQMVSASGDRTLRVWDTVPRAERGERGDR